MNTNPVFIAPSYEEKINNKLSYSFHTSKLIKRPDGMYDYNGSLNFSRLLTKPDNVFNLLPVKLHTVYGSVYLCNSYINSFENCPKVIHGDFIIAGSNIKSLKDISVYIRDYFDISGTNITDFTFTPDYIGKMRCYDILEYIQKLRLNIDMEKISCEFCFSDSIYRIFINNTYSIATYGCLHNIDVYSIISKFSSSYYDIKKQNHNKVLKIEYPSQLNALYKN